MSNKIKVAENLETDTKPLEAASKISKVPKSEIIKKEDYVSPLQHADKVHSFIRDCEVPSQTKGPFSRGDKERWKNVVETLLVRGVKSSRKIGDICGLTHVTANKFIQEIKEEWQSDLTPNKVNIRREQLYGENERIADFCWQLIQIDPLAKEVPQYLKIIGDTNTRRSRLVGAEQITLAVGQIETTNIDTKQIQVQAAAKLGVSVHSLKELGDTLATKMLPSLSEDKSEESKEDEKQQKIDSKDANENTNTD